jgi:NADH-quinone oxidoreductase subunit L
MAAWFVTLVIAVPWLGALCLWAIGDKKPARLHGLASAFAVLGGLVSLGLIWFIGAEPVVSIPMGSVFGEFTLVPNGLGVTLTLIAAIIGGLAVIFSNDYMRGEAQLNRYYALTLLFIGAMIGLVLSGSLLFMFFFWEITAFCSYALISFHNDDPKAVAGGIKALVITSLGGIGLLASAILSYTYLGSYQLNTFLGQAGSLPGPTLAFIAFGCLAAAAAKSAQVPFQTWLPDAMEAPTPISALIHAATMVNAGVYLLAVFYPAFEAVPGWKISVVVVGLLSALLAALMALFCTDLKRTLAYSTISQLGYMVYAIGIGGFFASQFHLLSHSVFKALLFLGAGAVIHAAGTRDMRQLGGLGRHMPFVRGVFVIGALALAGLPITNGFFSKELVLENGLAGGPAWAYAGMLLVAGLTGLYTLRMVMLVFYGPPRAELKVHDAPAAMRITLFVLAALTLTTWLLAGPLDHILAESLPYYDLQPESTAAIVAEILTSASTWITVAFVLLVASIWFWRERLGSLARRLAPLVDFINGGFGFEKVNNQIVRLTTRAASSLQVTQTGLLSWNVVAIVAGLILLLAIISWGG